MNRWPCIESTIEIPIKSDLVRVWIDQVVVKDGYVDETHLARIIKKIFKMKISLEEKIQLAHKYEPNISAIQLIHKYLNKGRFRYGVVVYLSDFNVDVHG